MGEHELIRAAREIRPVLERNRLKAEAECRLPDESANAMADAGLLRAFLPTELDGYEVDMCTMMKIIETTAVAESAAGWCLQTPLTYAFYSGILDASVAKKIWGPKRAAVAGGFNPVGKITRDKDGWRVTGNWAWGTSQYMATWMLGNCTVYEDGKPKIGPDGVPLYRQVFVPREQTRVVSNWNVMGLKGTGSDDYAMDDLFVPDEFTCEMFAPKPRIERTLYRLPLATIFAVSIAAPPLGMARRALDEFRSVAERKVPMAFTKPLRERPSAQIAIAKAEATLRSARAFLLETLEEVWDVVDRGDEPTMDLRALIRIACGNVGVACRDAVALVFHAAGAGQIRRDAGPLEQLFRDVHVGAQHIGIIEHNLELGGRVILGLDPGTPRF